MACQWEDEQTGGHCPDLVQHFTGTDQKWFTFTNGAHIDSIDPYTFDRWYDFLELFVAHQAPIVNAAVIHAAAPVIYQTAMGLPQSDVVTLPVDPIQALPTYQSALVGLREASRGAGALRQWRRDVTRRGPSTAGDPYPGFEHDFSTFPSRARPPAPGISEPTGTLVAQAAGERGCQLVHLERERPTAHRLREQHRYRRSVGQRIAVAMELGAESRRAPPSPTCLRR